MFSLLVRYFNKLYIDKKYYKHLRRLSNVI
nr:MAG TPA: hypothetical protein [Inoviridae sp.]